MRTLVPALFCLVLSTGCLSPLEREQKQTAVPFAERLLGYLDAGERELAWSEVSSVARLRYAKEDRIEYWFGIREPLGPLVRRRLEFNWERKADFLWSVPDGTYWEVTYQSRFENKDRVYEELLLHWDDGQWRLLNLRIR